MKIRQLINKLKQSPTYPISIGEVTKAHKFCVDMPSYHGDIYNNARDYMNNMMIDGVFPLPFDDCLFELNFETGTVLWVLVHNYGPWSEHEKHGSIEFMSCALYPKSGQFAYNELVGKVVKSRFNGEIAFTDQHLVETTGNVDTFEYLLRDTFENIQVVLGLMSVGSGVIQTRVPVQKQRVNDRRVRDGKLPLDYEHTVIRIDPSLLRLPGLVAAGGSHASPRLHWRRGHVRTLQSGRIVAVKPCIVGDVRMGVVTHDYVVGDRNATH